MQVLQEPGDIIVTFPSGLHSGLNFEFTRNEGIGVACEGWAKFCRAAVYCSCPKQQRVLEAVDDRAEMVRRLEPKLYGRLLERERGSPPEACGTITRSRRRAQDIPATSTVSTSQIEKDPRASRAKVFLTHDSYVAHREKQHHAQKRAKLGLTNKSSKCHTSEVNWDSADYTEVLAWLLANEHRLFLQSDTYKAMKRAVKDIFEDTHPTAIMMRMERVVFPQLLTGRRWGLKNEEFGAFKTLLAKKCPTLFVRSGLIGVFDMI